MKLLQEYKKDYSLQDIEKITCTNKMDLHTPSLTKMTVDITKDLTSDINFKDKDNIGLFCLTDQTNKNCIETLTKEIKAKRSKKIVYIRSGHQLLSTYPAMFLDIHGPTFSIVQNKVDTKDVKVFIENLLCSKKASSVILLTLTKTKDIFHLNAYFYTQDDS